MTVHRSRVARWSLTLLLVSCAVPLVLACEDKPAKQVSVSVLVILASEQGNTVDKKLECIAKEVQKMHPKLTNFELSKMGCKSLAVGKEHKFELVENQTASITVQKAADKMDRIRLKVRPPQMGDITYATPCGKFLPILTPYQTKKGEVLILAVRVQPCNGGK